MAKHIITFLCDNAGKRDFGFIRHMVRGRLTHIRTSDIIDVGLNEITITKHVVALQSTILVVVDELKPFVRVPVFELTIALKAERAARISSVPSNAKGQSVPLSSSIVIDRSGYRMSKHTRPRHRGRSSFLRLWRNMLDD
jgi:hypothetical protein